MICPKCHQPVQATCDPCPLCRFELQPFVRRVQTIYAISFAFFISTLIYSAIVYLLDTQGTISRNIVPAVLPYILLIVGVLQVGLARKIGQPLAQMRAMQQVLTVFITRLALIEGVAIYGLVMYMLTASIHWFVTFLAVSWLGFIVVGAQMPLMVQRLAELAVEEHTAGS